ncbi:MAG: ATP-dependent helicase HrpB [Planctomycetes bacterium]|nr:ATP-dependent helicase HrpB [Planctomycetota bacterium]
MPRQPLPIDSLLARIAEELARGGNLCLRAPTGSGKTTRVAPSLLDAGLAAGKKIILCEPRRLAARAAASRIARERETEPGGEIGWQVRFERRASAATRLLVVTEGILVRFLQNDPYLEDAGAVIFDEFHERNLDGDLGLAMARKLQKEARPDLKILAMSATLDARPLAAFLGNCNIIESEGSLYPVEIIYVPRHTNDSLEDAVRACAARALEAAGGHILIFLPGMGEIRRCREAIVALEKQYSLRVHLLHGDLPPEEQDAAIAPAPPGIRKLILSTNVAETSVTIEGVSAVIDAGLRRILKFDPSVGLDRLELGRISNMSATQRAGRAGRTGPGICYRLWSEPDQRALSASEDPECRRVDLSAAYLQLKSWGERDPRSFGWFEAPPPQAFDRAESLLLRLGAIDGGNITETGSQMSQIPAHPRIARLLVEGARAAVAREAALCAALLSERDPFRSTERRGGTGEWKHSSHSDLLDRASALEQYEDRGILHSQAGALLPGAASAVLRARDQYLRFAGEFIQSRSGNIHKNAADGDDAALRAIFTAYADRIAIRREPGSRRAVMAGGRGVKLGDASAVMEPEIFVCLDVDAGGAESLVRMASEARRAWIPQSWLLQKEHWEFDDKTQRVSGRRRLELDGVALEEVAVNADGSPEVAAILAIAAARDPRSAFALDDAELQSFLARVECLRAWMPDAGLPILRIEDNVREWCAGRASFAELRKLPIADLLRARLDYKQLQMLDREAPAQLQVPSGSFIKIQYSPGKPPVLAARLQELFGWRETPRIAAGRVPILLHLLAPNYRPQQITSDLANFWNHTYQAVRKELRARYPKHAWPEDPWTAPAQRGARRRVL